MAKEDDDDDSLPPLAEKTKDYLDDAKKGKPRSFLLVCKGTKVKYLAVKKKPAKKSDLSEAKKLGYKGDGYFGVITGSGKDLVFNLSMADGYKTEPVKDKSLKDFLEEHAEFKCTPTIKIVATAPDIPFDEEDLSHPLIARFIAMGEQISNVLDVRPEAEAELTKTVTELRLLLQDGDFKGAEPRVTALAARLQELLSGGQTNSPAPPAAPPQPPQPLPPTSTAPPVAPPSPGAPPQAVDNDTLKMKLQEALNKLVPQLKQAVATYPDKKIELLTPVAQIKKQMDAGELQEAKQGILAVGQLLKSVMAQGTSTNPPAQPEPDLRAEYERKLATLQPSYAQALKDTLGDTGKFRAVMAYAMEQAEAGVYATAIKAIDRLTLAVEQALAAGANKPQAQSENDLGVAYQAKLAALQPRYDQVLKEMLGDTTKFRAAMAMVTELAASGDAAGYEKAIKVLDRLGPAIDLAIAAGTKETDVIPENVVADRKKFMQSRWQEAIRASYAEIEKLASPIASQVPDEDSKELVSSITKHLDQFVDELNAAILNAQSATSNDLKPLDRALEAIKAYRGKIKSDPLLAHLSQAKASLGVDVEVSQQLLAAIDDLEGRLAG